MTTHKQPVLHEVLAVEQDLKELDAAKEREERIAATPAGPVAVEPASPADRDR